VDISNTNMKGALARWRQSIKVRKLYNKTPHCRAVGN
jgi:hypothetical protein